MQRIMHWRNKYMPALKLAGICLVGPKLHCFSWKTNVTSCLLRWGTVSENSTAIFETCVTSQPMSMISSSEFFEKGFCAFQRLRKSNPFGLPTDVIIKHLQATKLPNVYETNWRTPTDILELAFYLKLSNSLCN